MKNVKERLKSLERKNIGKQWRAIDSDDSLSTREKLGKLVDRSLTRKKKSEDRAPAAGNARPENLRKSVVVKDFFYSLDAPFGRVSLREWQAVTPQALTILAHNPDFAGVDPLKLIYVDSETTGLAGGTGTIPFMLGFGFFNRDAFQVKVFVLCDLNREDLFLQAVDDFLEASGFAGSVTFNGRAFDFPLLETRYILQRRRFPLLRLPHLDFLFPARTLWKHTYDSRKLGHLGEQLLGISRSDDVDAAAIPALYFNFLHSNAFSLLEPVIEHNALDIVGLAAVTLLACRYLEDVSLTADEGEVLGVGRLWEQNGWLEEAAASYRAARESANRQEVKVLASRRLSTLLKRKKLYEEALELWRELSAARDPQAQREISVHYEHRERNYAMALSFVEKALSGTALSPARRQEMEKRLMRLQRKIAKLEEKEE